MDRKQFFAVSGAAAVAVLTPAARITTAARAATLPYTWSYPQVNGGMGNVAQAHPNMADRLKLGGDLWGWYDSANGGLSWKGTMNGVSGIGAIYARGCRWSLTDPNTCYHAIGVLKSTGGYFGSSNGVNMTRHSGPQYGANLGSGAGGTLPRPVGNLIDVTLAGGVERIVTAAYNGLYSSTDKGASFKSLYSHTGNWKAIAAIDATSCLAAQYNTAGLTLVKGSTVSHPTAPGVIHDLRTIAGTVWGVGPGGLYRWTGTSLAKHPSSSFFANHKPTSIDGSSDGQVLFVGVADSSSAALSSDGGQSWRWVGKGNTGKTLDGRAYWLATASTNGWGQSRFSASQVCVDKFNSQHLYVAGRGGGWASHDGAASWYAAAPGGGEVTALRGGPGADEFAGNDNDWVGWHTTDAFGHVTGAKQVQSGLHGGLSVSSGGHSYVVKVGDITKDGQSIADDAFRGACVDPKCVAVSSSGKVLVGQYGGTLLMGTP